MLPYTTMESIRNTSESTEGRSNADRKESLSDLFPHGNPGNQYPLLDKLQEKRQLDRERSAGNGQVREVEKAVNESDSDQNSSSSDRIPSVAPATNIQ